MREQRRIIKEKLEMVGNIRVGKESWRITGMYVSKRRVKETLQELEEWIGGEEEEKRIIIGGDFNAKTGKR